jgi:hypothetical protein
MKLTKCLSIDEGNGVWGTGLEEQDFSLHNFLHSFDF